jgi:hypothetical protein
MFVQTELVLQDAARHARRILGEGDRNQSDHTRGERGGGTGEQREFHGDVSRGEPRLKQVNSTTDAWDQSKR